ncbi:hypothetical protein [Piscinibacter terrae]|uniref:Uncharacterized protein n=1 Tax=Piscinibacter terrae TaxID=2496871 RepID=A0A3N7JW17_9BURK|nr:hypothetical protein [Albitalea terrae]RQP25039.1 hypothetical protein DZC73_09295 [Albitalea terrae]
MSIDPDALASLASQYTQHMTSIRARRVQRLVKREFGGADHVLIVQVGSGASAVLGLSANGAAICTTDGTGKHAAVFKWLHEADTAIETRFDLLKDSLPPLSTAFVPLADLRAQVCLQTPPESFAQEASPWLAKVRDSLA